MRIILVRHGETEANAHRILQGHHDAPLTERGIPAIEATAQLLAHEPIEHLYSSDLPRTIATAGYIQKHHPHLELIQDPDAREYWFGDWDGQPADNYDWRTLREGDVYNNRPHNGETIGELQIRTKNLINKLQDRHNGEVVLLVTHGGVVRMMYSLVNDIPYPEAFSISPANASHHPFIINQPLD